MRQILIVNDDGIDAYGLRLLTEKAAVYGEVWVVAPLEQCSAMSQRITIRQKMEIREVDFLPAARKAYSLEGMPPDCVKVGLYYVMDKKPDYIFSGVNHGFNTGFDLCYSGTVGAAMEGLMNGVPSAAFSCMMPGTFSTAEAYLDQMIREVLAADPPPGRIINVNFPGIPAGECKGVLRNAAIAPMQVFDETITEHRECERVYVEEAGPIYSAAQVPKGTDAHGVMSGYITTGFVPCNVLL